MVIGYPHVILVPDVDQIWFSFEHFTTRFSAYVTCVPFSVRYYHTSIIRPDMAVVGYEQLLSFFRAAL